MSTQRRDHHSNPATKINRCGPRIGRQHGSCTRSAKESGQECPAPMALDRCALATVGSAPNRAARGSLQSDHSYLNFVTAAWNSQQDISRGSPPHGAGLSAATGTLTTRGSSLPFIPSPSGFTDFHPALPQFPANESRWTERYDGKRDLHFKHAA